MTYYRRSLDVASNSGLTEFRKYPLAYYHWVMHGKLTTPSMHEGTAFHCALHEPEKFARRYVSMPDMPLNSKAAKQAYLDATVGEILGEQLTFNGESAEVLRQIVADRLAKAKVFVLTENELITMRAMIVSLNQPCHRLARGIVARGQKERELRWTDPETGVKCKAKVDSWDAELGIESDLKRTVKITQRDFRRAVYSNDYHFQRAFYRRGLVANGEEVEYQGFVCGSPEPPHPWAVYNIPEEVIEDCDRKISQNLRDLAACLEHNNWPTVNNGEAVTLDMRVWEE